MIATASQIAEKLSKVTKSVWPSLLQQWSDDLLDETAETLREVVSDRDWEDVDRVIETVKENVNR